MCMITHPSARSASSRFAWLLAVVASTVIITACGGGKPPALIESAERRLAKEDAEGAVIDLRSALQGSPQSARARQLLGEALLLAGQRDLAAIEIKRAAEFGGSEEDLDPIEARLLLAQGRPAVVISRFATKSLGKPEPNARLKVELARAYLATGALAEAEAAVAAAQVAAPNLPEAALLQARMLAVKGDVAAALEAVQAVIARHPAHLRARVQLGELLATDPERKAQAAEVLRKVLDQQPKLLEAHIALLSMLLDQKDTKAAKEQLQRLQKALPNHSATAYYQALLAYLEQDMPRVREATQRLLTGESADPRVLYLAGAAELQLGGRARAEELLQKAVQGAPSLAVARQALARLYLQTDRVPAAVFNLIQLTAAHPEDAVSWRLLGQAHSISGDFGSADAAFARALALKPDDAQSQAESGKSRVLRGDVQRGLVELESAAAADPSSIAPDLALIAARMHKGDFKAALAAVDGLAVKLPAAPIADHLRGAVHEALGDRERARASYAAALGKQAAYLPSALRLASLDLADSDAAAAKRRFEGVLKANPQSADAMLGIAEVVLRQGSPKEKVVEWIDNAVKAEPANAATWRAAVMAHQRMEDRSGAMARGRDAVAAVPNDAALLLVVAEVQAAGGDHEQAVASLNKVMSLAPTLVQPYIQLGLLQLRRGAIAAARQHAAKAQELQPSSIAAARLAIASALAENRPDAALAVVVRLKRLLPRSPDPWQLEGEVAAERKQWPAGIAAFLRSLELGGGSEVAVKLHQTLLLAGQDAAAAEFRQSRLASHPDDHLFRVHLAERASAQGDWQAALKYYEAALKIQPVAPLLQNNLAYAMAREGDPGAVAAAQKAVRMAPWQPHFADTLAAAYASAKQLDKALAWQARAVTMAPDIGVLRLQLARYQIQAGDKQKARDELERLQRMGKDFGNQPEVTRLLAKLGD